MQRKQGRNETKCLQATRTARLTGSPSVLRLGKQERKCFGVVRKEGNESQASCCRFSPLWPLVHAAGALPSGARSVDECAKFMVHGEATAGGPGLLSNLIFYPQEFLL